MVDTPLNAYQRVPPPSDPDSAQSHLDGELQKLERTTRETISKLQSVAATYAPIANPVFTGDPQAPTPATADNDTSIATTGFVKAQDYATNTALTTGLSTKADTTALSSYATTTALTSGLAGKESTITGSGNAQQYWGGDKAFHAMPTQRLVSASVVRMSGSVTVGTSAMPNNASGPPGGTDGHLLLTLSVTTTSATQVIDLAFIGFGVAATNNITGLNGAIYANGVAIAAASSFISGTSYNQIAINGRYSPGAAGTYSMTVRVGTPTVSVSVIMNNNFGSIAATQLRAEVIEP